MLVSLWPIQKDFSLGYYKISAVIATYKTDKIFLNKYWCCNVLHICRCTLFGQFNYFSLAVSFIFSSLQLTEVISSLSQPRQPVLAYTKHMCLTTAPYGSDGSRPITHAAEQLWRHTRSATVWQSIGTWCCWTGIYATAEVYKQSLAVIDLPSGQSNNLK